MPRTAPVTPSRADREGLPTRRAVLSWGAATAVVAGSAGCADVVPGVPRTAAPSADTALVDEAVAALRSAIEQVRRTTRRHRGLTDELAPVRALHTTHLRALERATPSSSPATASPASPVPHRPSAALAAVAVAEQALQARLTGLAEKATSGELARLLGAMAAGTSQRLAAAPWSDRG